MKTKTIKKIHLLLLLPLILGLMSCEKDRNVVYYWNVSSENLEINNGEITIESSTSDIYSYDYDYDQILNMAIRNTSIVLISPNIQPDDELYLTIKSDNGLKLCTKLIISEILGIRNAYVNSDYWEFRNFMYSITDQLLLLGKLKLTISVENRDNPQKTPMNVSLYNKIYLCIGN